MASNGHVRLNDLRQLEDYVVQMADRAVGPYSVDPPLPPTAQFPRSGWKPPANMGAMPRPYGSISQYPNQQTSAASDPPVPYPKALKQDSSPVVVKTGTGGPVPIISGGAYDPAITEASWAPPRPVPQPIPHSFAAVDPRAPISGTASWGASGTPITAGFLLDLGEYNPKLYGRSAVHIYEEMRRSMGQVWGTLQAAKGPAKSANWEIRPGVNPNDPGYAQAKGVADFVRENLFGGMEFETSTGGVATQPWASVVYNGMLMLDFGCACHEDNWRIDGNYLKIRNLPARLPLTFYRHHTEADGETLLALEQYGYRGWEFVNATLPMQKACYWSLNQEGGNFWGIALLRPQYSHWFAASALYRIEAIASERNSLGLPVITLGPGYSVQDRATAFQYATQLSAHELSGLVLPPNHTFEFAGVHGQTRDSLKLIEHHLRQISATGLQQFLSLGTAPHGSRATAQTQHNFFMAASQYIAGHFAETLRQSTIRRLVRLNFGDKAAIPKIIAKNMRSQDITDILNSLYQLAGAGLLVSDKPIRDFIRDGLDLPEETLEGIVTEKGETVDEGQTPDSQFGAPKSALMPKQNLQGAGAVQMFEIHRPDTFAEEPLPAACHWVTIQGNHVCIGEGGNIIQGPARLVGKNVSHLDLSKKQQAALKNFKPMDKAKEAISYDSEERVRKGVGGEHLSDNLPFDVKAGNVGIEVKSLIDKTAQSRIFMRKECLERKLADAEKYKLRPFTVAVDRRGASPVVYVREGLGSFSLSQMTKVSSFRALRDHIQ